jgi:hypothetical protein
METYLPGMPTDRSSYEILDEARLYGMGEFIDETLRLIKAAPDVGQFWEDTEQGVHLTRGRILELVSHDELGQDVTSEHIVQIAQRRYETGSRAVDCRIAIATRALRGAGVAIQGVNQKYALMVSRGDEAIHARVQDHEVSIWGDVQLLDSQIGFRPMTNFDNAQLMKELKAINSKCRQAIYRQ